MKIFDLVIDVLIFIWCLVGISFSLFVLIFPELFIGITSKGIWASGVLGIM